MKWLLVQSCSATKNRVETPVQPLDLYDGYFFRIIKKAARAGRLEPGIDIVIISAKYGVVEAGDEIEYYDQQMDAERARELHKSVVNAIATKVDRDDHEAVWINLGNDYLPTVDGLESAIDVPVAYIEGCGIGEKGKQLKQLVYCDQPIPVQGE